MAEKMIRVQFSVLRELRLRLERYAAAQGMTHSDYIREAIAKELDRPVKRKSTSRQSKT